MIRLSWVVFLHALLLSAESIGIELLTTRLSLSPLAVAGNSIIIAGTALLAITAAVNKRETMSVFREWKVLVAASILVALGVYFWYDAVEYVGASKEGLLSGPLEVIVILVLARLFLKERLGRFQTVGAIIALIGFFAVVLSAGSVELLFTWGDAEAVLSALYFATGNYLSHQTCCKTSGAAGNRGFSIYLWTGSCRDAVELCSIYWGR